MRQLSIFGSTVLLATLVACGGSTTTSTNGNNSSGAGGSGAGGEASNDTDAGTPTNTTDADTATDAAAKVDAAPPVDNGAPSSTYPAFALDVPQVVSGGGPTLATPKVLPIFYPGYDLQAGVVDFVSTVGATDYWKANTTEYGVGALVASTAIILTDTPPTTIDDSAIQTWLASMLDGTHADFGQPDPNTIYTIFYPSTTTITDGSGGGPGGGGAASSCQDFGGYHNDITLTLATGTIDIAYAVVPECGSFGDLQGIDAVTGAASHELLEASTDPYPQDNPAYSDVDNDHLVWEFVLGGGEIGDMCAQFPTSFYTPTGYNHVVQRSWSNVSAMAGHDPCVPALTDEIYFNSMPVLADKVSLGGKGAGGLTTKGVTIPTGTSKVVEVDLFSDAQTNGSWSVSAQNGLGGGPSSGLSFKWDTTSGVNGDKLHVTMDVTKASQYGANAFVLTSQQGENTQFWCGFIGN
jgi:hypothetical protein